MKMHANDLLTLANAVKAILDPLPNAWPEYKAKGLSERRFRWDVFHACVSRGLVSSHSLYSYLNDSHIDTALKSVVPCVEV